MKIDLTKIPSGGKEIHFSLESDWWRSDFGDDRILGLEHPLSACLKMYPAGEKIVVDGFLSARMLLRCDRCLETYTKDLTTDFKVYLSMFPYRGEPEVELLESDLNLDFIADSFLDTDQIIKEQLILNLPMKSLCSNDCKGLCPLCGCNLNKATCLCHLSYEMSGNTI
ncbi:MAG: YceD family protein [Thermodesulfobacteriota bacterium]